jgi:hypothetical protein
MSGTGIGALSDPMAVAGSLKGILPSNVSGGTGPLFTESIPGDKNLAGGQSLPHMTGGRRKRRKSCHGGRRRRKTRKTRKSRK